jgi:hypothetical protein
MLRDNDRRPSSTPASSDSKDRSKSKDPSASPPSSSLSAPRAGEPPKPPKNIIAASATDSFGGTS